MQQFFNSLKVQANMALLNLQDYTNKEYLDMSNKT